MKSNTNPILDAIINCEEGLGLGAKIKELAAQSPETTINALEQLIEDQENFARLIAYDRADISNFLFEIKELDTVYREKITRIFVMAVINDDNFPRLFKTSTDFTNILFDININNILKQALFKKAMLDENFFKLFKKMIDVENFIFSTTDAATPEAHPACKLDKNISDEFLRQFKDKVLERKSLRKLIHNKKDLDYLVETFPERFSSCEEIIKNARLIAQGNSNRSSDSFFNRLPHEILVLIAAMTKTDKKQSDEDALDIAIGNLNKPIGNKKK